MRAYSESGSFGRVDGGFLERVAESFRYGRVDGLILGRRKNLGISPAIATQLLPYGGGITKRARANGKENSE
jgi:hypothetical protein